MPWSDFLGHSEQITRLRASVRGGRLAHAYALVGPPGIGKKRFAIEAAQSLLCERHADADLEACGECPSCRQVLARSHPDLLLVELPEGKRELPLKLFIGEDEKRGREGMCYELSLRPMSGRRRIAVISDAECLNPESGNCLLKTLEEPPPDSLLMLISASADALLPTIRSRCQLLSFAPLSEDHVRTLLLREGVGEHEAAEVAPLCDGSLETARQLLDPRVRAARESLFDLLSFEPYSSVKLSAQMNALVDASGGDRAAQRTAAGWVVRFAIEFFRGALVGLARAGEAELPQVSAFLTRFKARTVQEVDQVIDLLERCLAADRQLAANAAIPLCLEALFDDLGKVLRRP